MPRIDRSRAEGNAGRQVADKAFVSRKNAETETLDDVERKFLEPVARYLAVLREWSLERCDGTGADSPSDKP